MKRLIIFSFLIIDLLINMAINLTFVSIKLKSELKN